MGGRPCSVTDLVYAASDQESCSDFEDGADLFQSESFDFCDGIGGRLASVVDLSAAGSFLDGLAIVPADLDTDADEVVDFDTDADADAEDVEAGLESDS